MADLLERYKKSIFANIGNKIYGNSEIKKSELPDKKPYAPDESKLREAFTEKIIEPNMLLVSLHSKLGEIFVKPVKALIDLYTKMIPNSIVITKKNILSQSKYESKIYSFSTKSLLNSEYVHTDISFEFNTRPLINSYKSKINVNFSQTDKKLEPFVIKGPESKIIKLFSNGVSGVFDTVSILSKDSVYNLEKIKVYDGKSKVKSDENIVIPNYVEDYLKYKYYDPKLTNLVEMRKELNSGLKGFVKNAKEGETHFSFNGLPSDSVLKYNFNTAGVLNQFAVWSVSNSALGALTGNVNTLGLLQSGAYFIKAKLTDPVYTTVNNQIEKLPSWAKIFTRGAAEYGIGLAERFMNSTLSSIFDIENENGGMIIGTQIPAFDYAYNKIYNIPYEINKLYVSDLKKSITARPAINSGILSQSEKDLINAFQKYTSEVGIYDPTISKYSNHQKQLGSVYVNQYDSNNEYDNISKESRIQNSLESVNDKLSNDVLTVSSRDKTQSNSSLNVVFPLKNHQITKDESFTFNDDGKIPEKDEIFSYIKTYSGTMGYASDITLAYDENKSISEEFNKNLYPPISRRGFYDGRFASNVKDEKNRTDIYEIDRGKEIDDDDFIDFYFEDLTSDPNKSKIIKFRATITSLNDSVSSDWSQQNYVGRPDNFYIYKGFTRNIDISFGVYVNSKDELHPIWRKINYLAGMCYPVAFDANVAMRAPILAITVGTLYRGLFCIMNSFSMDIDSNTLWELNKGEQLPLNIPIHLSMTVLQDDVPLTHKKHFAQGSSIMEYSFINKKSK
jgi:hypothetical protein